MTKFRGGLSGDAQIRVSPAKNNSSALLGIGQCLLFKLLSGGSE